MCWCHFDIDSFFPQEGDDDSEDEEHLNNGNVSRGGELRDDDDDVSDPVNVSSSNFASQLCQLLAT